MKAEEEMRKVLKVLRELNFLNHEFIAVEMYKAGVKVSSIELGTGIKPSALPGVLRKHGEEPNRLERIPEDLEEATVRMIQEGKGIPADSLARRLGISNSSLRRIARDHGLKLWTAREGSRE